MPHVGPVLKGRTFFCPHCGALYSATPSLVPKSEPEAAKCVVCHRVMGTSDNTTKAGSSFELIHRPEDA
jgi:transcription elongation factor Elf1